MAEIINLTDVLDYMHIDYADDVVKRNIQNAIKSADSYLKGSLGEGYPVDDPRCQELIKIIASEFYDNRGMTETTPGNVRKLVSDLSWQIRLEMRRTVKNE